MDEKLFHEFPPIPTESWEEVIQKDLKGADYDKKLVWKTIEGFPVRPYYRNENLNNLDYLMTNPGEFPFTRGNNATNNWEIRQDIYVEDVKKSNALAHKLINGGVTSIGFVFKTEIDKAGFASLMVGINPEEIAINFDAVNMSAKYVEFLADYVKTNGFDAQKVKGSNNFDSLGYILINGKSFCGNDSCKCAESMLKEYGNTLPKFKMVSINAKHVNNAGGSAVQELAFGLAMGAEYLRKFAEENISVDDIAKQLQFNFAVGSNYFMEIAKLRAAKFLWAKIVKANNPSCDCYAQMYSHSETSTWNKTIYDPYVNMLRSTTEAMSAVLGGTNSLNVNPFDSTYSEPTEFSLRIARNVQILIKEEAHFDKVVDPAAGSYYIENLTDSIIENAWNLFLQVEEKGGFVAALKEGFIQNEIEATAQKRNKNIETRREIFLGTNQYPNFNEILADKEIKAVHNVEGSDSTIKPIKLYRGAEAFEAMRLRTDKSEKRPVVFMLTIGNLTFRKARAQFSSNFFACAGFEVIDNNGFENIEQGIQAAREKNADIIVLCSSDDEYTTYGPELNTAKDNEVIVIAGSPKCKDELESKGITNFVHVRSNVLEELEKYQQLLGIN